MIDLGSTPIVKEAVYDRPYLINARIEHQEIMNSTLQPPALSHNYITKTVLKYHTQKLGYV